MAKLCCGFESRCCNLLVEILDFNKKARPQNLESKREKKDILKNFYALFEGREIVLDAFESKMFLIKIKDTAFSDNISDHSDLNILTPKAMLQRLSIALAQVKAGNVS